MSLESNSNDAEVPRAENDDVQFPRPEVDIIWHNMYAPSTFITWRKHSSRPAEQLLVDFTNLVNRGVFGIISLSVSKASFVAVVACEREWDEVEKDVLEATR